ncbi:MAG: deoxyribose-phosphate aldolase [Clostridia bacterium]|jgi:deoxyribose-phosphate aldolase|nr:deoxyribose-phosphate aldolase [Clostridia bacterium]MBR6822707.1 deoxyribose-phosphate aldolase [Clostridia bacterium]
MIRNINRYIDLSHRRDIPETFDEYLEKARKYNFRCIFANRFQYDYAARFLEGTDVILAAGCNFPDGKESIEAQLADFRDLYNAGYREIEGTLNQYAVEHRMYEYLERELTELSVFCNQRNITSKIILETCKMDYECLEKICKIALKAKPTYLKTSTGTSFKGAEIEKVRFMKEILEDKVQIKAAGGIGTYEKACEFIEAGCSCIGATKAIEIVEGERKAFSE